MFGGFGGGGFGGGQSADADVWGSLKRVEKLSAASFPDKVQGPGNEMWLVLFYLPQSECYRLDYNMILRLDFVMIKSLS